MLALKLILPGSEATCPGNSVGIGLRCFPSIFGRFLARWKEGGKRGGKIGIWSKACNGGECFPKGRSGVVGGDPELRQTRADRYSSGEL